VLEISDDSNICLRLRPITLHFFETHTDVGLRSEKWLSFLLFFILYGFLPHISRSKLVSVLYWAAIMLELRILKCIGLNRRRRCRHVPQRTNPKREAYYRCAIWSPMVIYVYAVSNDGFNEHSKLYCRLSMNRAMPIVLARDRPKLYFSFSAKTKPPPKLTFLVSAKNETAVSFGRQRNWMHSYNNFVINR